MRKKPDSILSAAVLPERGAPTLYEYKRDGLARTDYDDNGLVIALHTPKCDTLRRIHEAKLHANHTTPKRLQEKYFQYGVNQTVANIVEDCVMHLRHWPWDAGKTPQEIKTDCYKTVRDELKALELAEKAGSEEIKENDGYKAFALRLRAGCIREGIKGNGSELGKVGFTRRELTFADQLRGLIYWKKEAEAAYMMQQAFFPDEIMETEERETKLEQLKRNSKGELENLRIDAMRKTFKYGPDLPIGLTKPELTIIELPHTVPITDEKRGKRMATSGSRLQRSLLRKPVLPQRLFKRRARRIPGGTILIDASGSMGDWSNIVKWCEESPYATLAYYAGKDDHGKRGQLFIYARDGYKCERVWETEGRGNDVDGLAIDWLMQQSGPRRMVTDRCFCGAYDSEMQIMRLARLEKAGEIEVKNYKRER